MTSDLVSIVVPIYSVEEFLDRCVKSIVDQTYRNLEIILVDDGSPDSCPDMCDAWAEIDDRIKVVHKTNQGLGEARNTGLRIAKGKYIFFFDSDDYVAPNIVERCVTTAEVCGADTVVYGRNNVFSDGTIINGKSAVTQEIYGSEEIKNILLPSLFSYSLGYGVSAWSKMHSTRIIHENLLLFRSERTVISEDSIFSLDYFAKATKVAVISDRLYFYCRNDNSLTRSFKMDRQEKNNQFLKSSIDKARELGLPKEVFEHIKARYHGMTLGALMQIVRSDLRNREKKAKLRKAYKDDVLRETLNKSVICLDDVFPRLFWICLKFKCYLLCDLLLICNKYR